MSGCALDRRGAELLRDYVLAGAAVLGGVPTQTRLFAERFFDDAGGNAAGDSRAVRRPDQPGLGDGAAQAILPVVRLRAPGCGDGRRDRAVAGTAAQLSAGVRLLDVARRRRPGAADAGGAAIADVRDALALERDPLADAPAQPRRQARPARAPADARPGSDRLGVSGADRLPGQPRRRRDRDPRPSAGARDHPGLPGRGDGRRGVARRARSHGGRSYPDDRARAARAVGVRPRDPQRQPLRLPGRRPAGRAAHARGQPPPRSARRDRRADRRARSGGGRIGARRIAGRGARSRRAARSAARRGRAARGDGARPRLRRSVRRARGRAPRRAPGGRSGPVGRGRTALAGGAGLAGAPLRPRRRRAARPARTALVRSGERARRDRPRSPDLSRTHDGRADRGAARRAPVGRRGGAGADRARGRRAARAFSLRRRGARRRGPVVRAPPARADQPPDARRPPARDRAGHRRRLLALPVRVAKRAPRQPASRAAGARAGHRAAAGVRGRGWRLGTGDSPGTSRRVRLGLAGRALPLGWRRLGAARRPTGGRDADPGRADRALPARRSPLAPGARDRELRRNSAVGARPRCSRGS